MQTRHLSTCKSPNYMARTLTRRRFTMAAALSTISLTGCLDGIFAGRIPLAIMNKGNKTETITVELLRTDTDSMLLSETLTLDSGEEQEFEVGPIAAEGTYAVEYRGTGHRGENSISGTGVGGGEVVIGEEGEVQVFWIVA